MEDTYVLSLKRFFNGLRDLYLEEEKNYQKRLRRFFEPLVFKYKVAKEIKKQTDRFLASDFNLIDIISPDENKISDIIALLLKPDGEHGQGKVFLEKFLETLKKTLNNKKFIAQFNNPQVTVVREHLTDKGRRIDILLKFSDGFIIGIENKPWAGEQGNQLEDYSKYLEEVSKGNYLLIYLDGWGRKATSISKDLKDKLKRENKFLEVSYHEFLVPWLKKCFKECEAEKVRWFLRDFISWIEKTFQEGGKMDKKELIKKLLFEGNIEEQKEKFEIAWDIWSYFDEIRKEIAVERIFRPLTEKVNEILPSQFIISYFDFGCLYITRKDWKEKEKDRGIVAIAVERGFRDYTTAGLVKNSDKFKVETEDIIRDKLSEKGFRTTHSWWLGYLPSLPETISLPIYDYYKTILMTPDRLIDDYLQVIKQILEILEGQIVELLEKFVEERKKQLEVENG